MQLEIISRLPNSGYTVFQEYYMYKKDLNLYFACNFICRLLPMNFTNDDMATGILRDRTRAGASMADIDPMDLDRSVTFDSIGGLGKHLRKLKEMIVFPLMYPEVFDKFKIAPPRGVLFYGPPGFVFFLALIFMHCSITIKWS